MPRKKSAAKKAREAAAKTSGGKTGNSELTGAKKIPENVGRDETSEIKALSSLEPESSEEDESPSEEEDDYGELITTEVESGINSVLEAIRNEDKEKLLNPNVRFFEDLNNGGESQIKSSKHKPIYLKDYHRMNLLSGGAVEDEELGQELKTVDGEQSYAAKQKKETAELLDEIKNQFSDDDANSEDGVDDFLVKKEQAPTQVGRRLRPLPNPDANEEAFLTEFVDRHAWIPKPGDKEMNLDGPGLEEDDEKFDEAAERFENAYNFRYEDPNAAEIVSYARNQATLRRTGENSRKRKRNEEKNEKLIETKEKEIAVKKKKKEKINQLTDVLEQIKKEYGADIDEDLVQKITDSLMNGEFENGQWDTVLNELFNDDFYSKDGKPTWDEDDEIMGEFYGEQSKTQNAETTSQQDAQYDEEGEDESTKKSRKERLTDRKLQKKEKRKVTDMIENAVEEKKSVILEEVEDERRGRSQTKDEQEIKFRYREVSPEAFGLTTREIFTADDADLNEFIGLKKFAPYRASELKAKDRRKVMKSRRMREWRKKVFGNERGMEDQELASASGDSIGSSQKPSKRSKARSLKQKENK
ncbi:LAMI_0G07096g1_1 [Lachancea mirantina]|uniref:LAMI_0G07096g1_1 n=1 Tax=Lachancea mirantina TaxID=1230905 RepID=A0A1G4K9M7_9SACH|nr:LAMI_0G07096g1_1 [Lachancea mirantina]